MTTKFNIGKNVKKYRIKQGFSQKNFAKESDVKMHYFNKN